MSIYKIAAKLKNALPSGYVIAIKPDHPHLYSGPDILIGGAGQLDCIFNLKNRELTRPEELEARLIISRLSLPSHTRCILMLSSSFSSNSHLVSIYKNFHKMIDIDDVKGLLTYIKDSGDHNTIDIVPKTIREKASKRYQYLYEQAIYLYSRKASRTKQYELFQELKNQYEYLPQLVGHILIESGPVKINKPRNILDYSDYSIALPKFEKHKPISAYLRSYCTYSINNLYTLDRGIPYPTTYGASIFISESIPKDKFDEYKPLRAAAFAGWIFSPATSYQDFNNLTLSLKHELEERLK